MVDVNLFIKTIRESFQSSTAVYTCGCCYQFYEILKVVFPEAEPYYDGNHVWTKIDGKFYDIKGECKFEPPHIRLIKELNDVERKTLNRFKLLDEDRPERNRILMERTIESAKKKNFGNN